jgi:hypothetical protein
MEVKTSNKGLNCRETSGKRSGIRVFCDWAGLVSVVLLFDSCYKEKIKVCQQKF